MEWQAVYRCQLAHICSGLEQRHEPECRCKEDTLKVSVLFPHLSVDPALLSSSTVASLVNCLLGDSGHTLSTCKLPGYLHKDVFAPMWRKLQLLADICILNALLTCVAGTRCR